MFFAEKVYVFFAGGFEGIELGHRIRGQSRDYSLTPSRVQTSKLLNSP